MTPRIEKAIDIFLDAINEGSLAKGSCAACAVGNLVSSSIGENYPFTQLINDKELHQIIAERNRNTWVFGGEVNKTDFSVYELCRIERVFENNTNIHWLEYADYSPEEIRADQIRGLEAVVKVMLELDNAKEDYKEVFTKRAELIPL